MRTRLLLAALILSVAADARAQTPPVDLSAATLEDLMNIEITSASRKEQRAEDVPAAVYVITREDIRRSGMTSVPDLLRLVPGVQVAQINSNKWAVSVRGFNSLYSNKLLVLVDGRTLYNPLFSGVWWDTEDLMLDDVDRIEVIRGPGAAVWGANAVNGVINIMTRSAAETRGLLVRADAGTFERGSLAVRYGRAAGPGNYRAYVQLSSHGNTRLSAETPADDRWHSMTAGFRGDWSTGPETFMLQGSTTSGRERPLWLSLDPTAGANATAGAVSETLVGNVLARWTHTHSNGATLQLQSFVDASHRLESIGENRRTTLDVEAVYHSVLGPRHDLVIGGGYRHINEAMMGGFGYSFTPDHTRESEVNAFAQDEMALVPHRVALTLGAKLEYDSLDEDATVQPTARLMWSMTPRQRLWGAVSHALRTPSLVDTGIHIDFPPAIQAATPNGPPVAISVSGNPAAQNERLNSTEAGYRLDIGSMAAIDVAGFIGRYGRLQTNEPSAPSLIFVGGRPIIQISAQFQNLLNADTKGAEVTAQLRLSKVWQVDGAFSAFHLTPHPDPASQDPSGATFDGDAPGYQWRAHTGLTLGPRLQADVLLLYVGSLDRLNIPSYTRADVRVEWALTPRFLASIEGQNLLDRTHAEFSGNSMTIVSTRVPRSGSVRLTWRY